VTTPIDCREERRRADVRSAELFGLDFVEVDEAQTSIEVFFLGRAPAQGDLEAANVRITGGRPVTVTSISVHRFAGTNQAELADWMQVSLDRPGDFSPYTLSLVKLDQKGRSTDAPLDGFDARYASATFSFKVSCPSDLDCATPEICPPPVRVQPEIDYLAKDYESFRRLIFDRLATTMPEWHETHVPDIGVMLVELLAYAGDQLSYYQDAVATEAYFATARQRISVRRHARLVDYALSEGCNARAWITLATDTDTTLSAEGIFFCTRFPGSPDGAVLQPADFAHAPPGSCEIFEPLVTDPSLPIQVRAAHSEIRFYTWGDAACCLPKGAMRATLADAWVSQAGGPSRRALALAVNDVLIFEEVVGPRTGVAADADPAHRQAVRLTKVTPAVDPLYDAQNGGRPVVEIEWCWEDALTFPLCISARLPAPECEYRENLSVARGNVLLVDSGARVDEPLGSVPVERSEETCATDCAPAEITRTTGRFQPVLSRAPLTFAQDLPACGCASGAIAQDPHRALPQIVLTGTLDSLDGPVTTQWHARADLLESGPGDAAFVAEIDDGASAHLRFGNGAEGRSPAAGTAFTARYRVGNGPAGNVGAETIRYLVFRGLTVGSGKLAPRNPMPATGGTAPETVAEARMFAPFAAHDVLERAITADDYAALASDDTRRMADRARLFATAAAPAAAPFAPGVPVDDPRAGLEEEPGEPAPLPADLCLLPFQRLQAAQAALRWTGSWYEADVILDPRGAEFVDTELVTELEAFLEPFRRIGHDLGVRAALDVGLSVCVAPNYLRGHAEAALSALLGAGTLPDGTLGFFHPDRLTFGQAMYVSPIVAAAQGVPGVVDVELTRLARYVLGSAPPRATTRDVPANGSLKLGRFEIARLDANPNAPGNGRLTLLLRGGR
jgi:hypothetical protein